jgi:hypothetical protein
MDLKKEREKIEELRFRKGGVDKDVLKAAEETTQARTLNEWYIQGKSETEADRLWQKYEDDLRQKHFKKVDCEGSFLDQQRRKILPPTFEKPNEKPDDFVDPNAQSNKLAPIEGVKKIVKSIQETWNSICWYRCK